jgi:hypothetical protein
VQRAGEVGQVRVGAGVGELAAEGDGFFDGGQALLAAAQAGEVVREVGQPFRAGLGLGVGGRVSRTRWAATRPGR